MQVDVESPCYKLGPSVALRSKLLRINNGMEQVKDYRFVRVIQLLSA